MRISLTSVVVSICLLSAPALAKSSLKAASTTKTTLPSSSAIIAAAPITAVASKGLPDAAKLVIGAGGIYAAFLYYGTLQEDVFHYVASDGSKFKAAWFLQTLGE